MHQLVTVDLVVVFIII